MELFAFETLSVLESPSPEKVVEGDAQWMLEASRRRAALYAEEADGDPNWLLKAAQFSYDTASYRASLDYVRRARERDGRESTEARTLLIECLVHLALAEGGEANRCVKRLEEMAALTSDPFVIAVGALAKETNRQKNQHGVSATGSPDSDEEAMVLLDETAQRLTELGEIDLALQAHLGSARLRFATAKFFWGVATSEVAMKLVRRHGCWGFMGRLLGLTAATASDQGYRRGVEEALRRAISWCDYLGDVYGRIEARISLGRLLGYQMPAGVPQLAQEPHRHLQLAAEEAESLGLHWLLARADGGRAWIFDKSGDREGFRQIVGEEKADKGQREHLADLNEKAVRSLSDQVRLQTAARLYDGIQDSQDAFFVFNALRDETGICRDFGSTYSNRAADRILEQSGTQIYLYSEARQHPCFAGLDEAFEGAANGRQNFADTHPVVFETEEVWYQRRVVPSGNGLVLSLSDVTAEKRIEAALRHAAESAERSERVKSAFLASMSHEIRTPLNGVLGLARMLSETNLDPIQKAYVEDIVLSGDILLDLIGDVLDLSKIEAQNMKLTPTVVSLTTLVASIVKLFRGQAEERATTLSYRIEAGVPETVLVDGVRLRQILSNLVGNAVKFTREGEVEIRVSSKEGMVVFEVRDNGVGIPPHRLEAIFDRFQQAEDFGHDGTGLGLTIARALAQLKGGDIAVESELGCGSTFRVSLPLKPVDEVLPAPVQSSSLRFDGRRILLVDDNRVNMLVSSHALRKFGCEVVYAEDGRRALEILEEDRFDLILMDVRMPIMNGLDATQEIRRRESGSRRTPIVALTAGALVQEHDECFEAGMDDFATKPVTFEAIRDVLARWLCETPFSAKVI